MSETTNCTIRTDHWLNGGEVEHAYTLARSGQFNAENESLEHRLLAAAVYLFGYMQVINSSSDGWPHWSAGTRPAEPLCRIVSHLLNRDYHGIQECESLSEKAIGKAMGRIEAFSTRRNLQKLDRPPMHVRVIKEPTKMQTRASIPACAQTLQIDLFAQAS